MKLPLPDEGSTDHLVLCAMAQIGRRATVDEIMTEIHNYNLVEWTWGGKGCDAGRSEIEATLNKLDEAMGEVTCDADGWMLCPIEESNFDYEG